MPRTVLASLARHRPCPGHRGGPQLRPGHPRPGEPAARARRSGERHGESRNAKAYAAVVDRFALGEYCLQLCGWVSSLVCTEFCFCICPPVGLAPVFFKIGNIEYATAVDCTLQAGTGLTVMLQEPYAFFSDLRLNGVLPQLYAGVALEYTFEYCQLTSVTTTLNGEPLSGSSDPHRGQQRRFSNLRPVQRGDWQRGRRL